MEENLRQELERTKEDLQDIETYLEEFNSFLPIAVSIVNPVGVVVNINAAFEDITGHSTINATGKKIDEFFVEGDVVRDFFGILKDDTRFATSAQVTLLSENYGSRAVTLTASSRKDKEGQLIGFFVGINDITELKDLQDRLENKVEEQTKDLVLRTQELEKSRNDIIYALSKVEEERKKTYSLVMNLSDGLVYIGGDGEIEMINSKAEILLRINRKEVHGSNIYEEGTKTGRFLKFSSSLKPGVNIDREHIEIDVDYFVELSTIEVKGEDGGVVGTIILLHDISKDKALENLKAEFVSVAAHQMRTPLAAIKWAFEILLSSDDDKFAPDLKKIAENGFESTNRILQIVNDFLDVDAAESVSSDYIFAPVNVSKVIEEVFISLAVAAREKNIDLVYENENDPLPFIQADQKMLIVVFQNLIENAIKYTMRDGSVTVQVLVQGDFLSIAVSDEGIGIPSFEQKNIFSKFFRAGNAKKTETDGNGLGLYTAKRIIEKHGGEISFESKEGEGTTFQFTIPLYRQ